MRLVVSGSRNGYSEDVVNEVLDSYLAEYGDGLVIIEGCAAGVDTQAFRWAQGHMVLVIHYPAPWSHLGKRGGRWRNLAMVRVCGAEEVVCFHPDIANARGTHHMAITAAKEGVPVQLIGSTMPLPRPTT